MKITMKKQIIIGIIIFIIILLGVMIMFFINNRNSKNNLQNSNQELSNLQTSNQETETNNTENAVANYQHVNANTTVGDYYGSYRAMCEAQKEGKIKSIGISNFRPDRLVDLCMNQEIKPAIAQMELHPYAQQKEYREKIAKAHGKTPAQVILKWHLQEGYVAILGATDHNFILANIDIFDFKLTSEEMEEIAKINKNKRYYEGTPELLASYAAMKPDLDGQK